MSTRICTTLAYATAALLAAYGVEGHGQQVIAIGQAGGQALPHSSAIANAGDQEAPPVWIGVRLVPIPEALAAHVGNKGLMIGNIVNNSPADGAGLDRHDIVTAFNDRQVDDMQGLIDAIVSNGAGKVAKLSIIRGGKPQTLDITPEKRPASPQMDYKYTEALPQPDDAMHYFGYRSMLDPQGNWKMEPLGPMPNLPQFFKNQGNWQGFADMHDMFKTFQIDPSQLPQVAISPDSRVEVRINKSQDGNKIEIHRTADGEFEVTRTDESGNQSSATYGDAEEFQQKDAEAFETFQQFSGGHTSVIFAPSPDKLKEHQDLFQKQLQKEMSSSGKSGKKDAGNSARSSSNKKGQARKLVISDDGSIHVTLGRGASAVTKDFANKEAFKQQDHELYERFRSMLEGD